MQPTRGIYFEYKPAAGHEIHGRFHAYIVFRDGNGGERVIRGGIPDIFGNTKIADFADFGAIPLGGDISTQVDIPLQTSMDKYDKGESPETRHSRKLDLGGRDPEAVWKDMVERVRRIEPADIDYNLEPRGQNSNSVVRTALEAGRIDSQKAFPPELKPSDLPGFENDLSNPDQGIPPFGADPVDRELEPAPRGRLPRLKLPDGEPGDDAAIPGGDAGDATAKPAVKPSLRRAERTDAPGAPLPAAVKDGSQPVRARQAVQQNDGELTKLIEAALEKLGSDAPEGRALLQRIADAPETLEELIAKPAEHLTQAEIDRIMAEKANMTGRDALFAPLNGQANRWFDQIWDGLPPRAEDAARARIALEPVPARTPAGATVAEAAARVGTAVIEAAARDGDGIAPQVVRLQRAISGLDRDRAALKPDGVFGPRTAARLRAEVARGHSDSLLDAFDRVGATLIA